MPRWWLITIAVAGTWLALLGAGQFGFLAKLSLDVLAPHVKHAVFGVCAIAAFQCARQGMAAWGATLAALAMLLNTVAPAQWPSGWEHPFQLVAGVLLLAFSVRQWS
jgi:hypothetical protein